MSKQTKKAPSNFKLHKNCGAFQVYKHKLNGLQLVHYPIPGTGVVTSNITYKVGSVDERRGESGLAHMLEHMLFKPTKQDVQQGITDGAGMKFERETGALLNANTHYDRTTYYFSFPKQYTSQVVTIEANRMQDLVLSDKEFQPERGNVLSEFDMYNGDPYFALEVAMRTAAFRSHAYDHEVIGFREDIEDYTTEKLQAFYDMYYQPNNATLMLIGDISKSEAINLVEKKFGSKKNKVHNVHREAAREPAIVGPTTTTITRPGTTNILAFAYRQAAFPSQEWYTEDVALRILADGPESILHKAFVDTGLVSSLDHAIFNSPQSNLGMMFFRLAAGTKHADIEEKLHRIIANIKTSDVAKQLKKEQIKYVTREEFKRASSLSLAAKLTEFAAADALDQFDDYKTKVDMIRPNDVIQAIQRMFDTQTLTTGYYRSV